MCPAQTQLLTQVAYLLVRFAQEFQSVEDWEEVFGYLERIAMMVESRNGIKIAVVPVEKK